jgi:hypothetical protein
MIAIHAGKDCQCVCGWSKENGAVSELMGDIGSKTVFLGMKSHGENSVKKIAHRSHDQL